MFDIENTSTNDVFITQINHLFNKNNGIINDISLYNVRVYHKEGTHQSYENDESEWKQIIDTGIPISSLGDDTLLETTPIVLSQRALLLRSNARHALYITVTNENLLQGSNYMLDTDTDPENPFRVFVESEDESLRLYTGSRVSGVPFDGSFPAKATAWIGTYFLCYLDIFKFSNWKLNSLFGKLKSVFVVVDRELAFVRLRILCEQ